MSSRTLRCRWHRKLKILFKLGKLYDFNFKMTQIQVWSDWLPRGSHWRSVGLFINLSIVGPPSWAFFVVLCLFRYLGIQRPRSLWLSRIFCFMSNTWSFWRLFKCYALLLFSFQLPRSLGITCFITSCLRIV